MSAVMLRRALKDLRWTALWYALGLFGYAVVIVAFYPTVRDNVAQFRDLINAYPKVFRQAFGVTDFATFTGFIGAEYLSLIWPMIVAAFAITVGTATVAQEIERGTIDLWLSVPEGRVRLLLAKGGALCTGLLALAWTTIGGLALGAALIGETVSVAGLLAAGAVASAFGLAVGSGAMLCSSFMNDRGRAAGLAAGLTLASYLAWIVAGLSARWDWLRHVSIFAAYQPQRALETGRVPAAETLALLAVGLACTAAAAAIFRRRNIAA